MSDSPQHQLDSSGMHEGNLDSDGVTEMLRFDTIDAITTLYASKLMEGYTLTPNGEVCFRCSMPLMQRETRSGEQAGSCDVDKYDRETATLDEISSNGGAHKQICVVCEEEWESTDSFEQKLVVFSAMQAAQGGNTTDEAEVEDENREDEIDSSQRIEGAAVRDKYTIVQKRSIDGDDDQTLIMDDLKVSSCQEEDDDGDDYAMVNIEVTLRTRCQYCAMDLPVSESVYSTSKEQSSLYYPHGANECSFCRVVNVTKQGSSADETTTTTTTTTRAIDSLESASILDNFDLLVIQANLDKMDVKEELIDADDKTLEGATGDELKSKNTSEGNAFDYRMMEPEMEIDGAEVRLMSSWNIRDEANFSTTVQRQSQEEEKILNVVDQVVREAIELEHGEVQLDKSNNSMSADMKSKNMAPERVNDSLQQMANSPDDNTNVVKSLITKVLQKNIHGRLLESEASLEADHGSMCSTDDYHDKCHHSKLENGACITSNIGSYRDMRSKVGAKMTTSSTSFTRDPPTTELDPPAKDEPIICEEHVERVRSEKKLENEFCSISRGMDPPETDAVTLDSRDGSPPQTRSVNIVERRHPQNIKSSMLHFRNTVRFDAKTSIRHRKRAAAKVMKEFDHKCFSDDRDNEIPPAPSKFHVERQKDIPVRSGNERFMSEDDVRCRLAQIKLQFSRKDTKVGRVQKSFHPASSRLHIIDKTEHPITRNDTRFSDKQRLHLSPTAAARHRRIKEDLLARNKALSPQSQTSLVSIE